MDENKKFKGMNKAIIGIAAVTCLTIGANVYASVSGQGNLFFMIRNLFTQEEVVIGEDSLFSDRDITISYSSIEIADGLNVQIRRVTLENNLTTLYIFAEKDTVSLTENPMKYKVYDENGNLLTEYVNNRSITDNYFTDAIKINKTINPEDKIRVEIYASAGNLLSNITIDLKNKELVVDGKKVEKLSEIELKKYLGIFAKLNDIMNGDEIGTVDTLIDVAGDINEQLLHKPESFKRQFIDGVIDSFCWTDKSDLFNSISSHNGLYTYDKETDSYVTEGYLSSQGLCFSIEDIGYNDGVYTIRYIYSILQGNEPAAEGNLPKYESIIKLKYNPNSEYSKFKIVDFTEGKLIEKENNVESVDIEIGESDDIYDFTVRGYKNNVVAWEYKTASKNIDGQFAPIEYLGEYNKELVCINENGTIKALDYNTGRELWRNPGYGMLGTTYLYDQEGNLYVYALDGGNFFAVDKNGKTLKSIITGFITNTRPNASTGVENMSIEYNNGKAKEVQLLWNDLTEYSDGDYELKCQLTINLENDKVESKILSKIKIIDNSETNTLVDNNTVIEENTNNEYSWDITNSANKELEIQIIRKYLGQIKNYMIKDNKNSEDVKSKISKYADGRFVKGYSSTGYEYIFDMLDKIKPHIIAAKEMKFEEYNSKYGNVWAEDHYNIMSSIDYLNGVYERIIANVTWEEAFSKEITFEIYQNNESLYIRFALDDEAWWIFGDIIQDWKMQSVDYNKKLEVTETVLTESNQIFANNDKNDSYKYVIHGSGDDAFVDEDRNVRVNGKDIGHKFKMLLTDGYMVYIVTEDNYLYFVNREELVSNNKINEIMYNDTQFTDATYYRVTFEDSTYEFSLENSSTSQTQSTSGDYNTISNQNTFIDTTTNTIR